MNAADSANGAKKTRSLGLLPAVNFDADKGFGYGVILQLDDKRREDYQPYYFSHRLILQRTTRGIGKYIYSFDSKYLLPRHLRTTITAGWQVSKLEPFYGWGGAQTRYNSAYVDEEASETYQGKFYYHYDKRYFQIDALIQGPIRSDAVRWLAGITLLKTVVDTIDYSDFDESGTPARSLLANQWRAGLIDTQEQNGGYEHSLLLGLVLDRRDHERSPHTGYWSEILLRWTPQLPFNDFNYTSVTATHRHYVPLSSRLTFAVRVSGRVMSEGIPFFTAPRQDASFFSESGLGGGKTIRGVLWQRVKGRNSGYTNLELRHRFVPLFRTGYVAGNLFYDAGRTFDQLPDNLAPDSGTSSDRWHQGVGVGIHIATNRTFVTAFDIGRALDGKLDGSGLQVYIGLDWLY